MTVRCFVDTNVLIYTRDPRDSAKMTRALTWLDVLRLARRVVLSHQVLAEYYSVATTRLRPGLPAEDARRDLELFLSWPIVAGEQRVYTLAFDVQDRFHFAWWNCLIAAAALIGGCTHLISEDFSHGQRIDGLTVINPFRTEPEAILA